WYPPRDLSVESIQNRKSKILKPPHLSVGSIENLKSQISNRLTAIAIPNYQVYLSIDHSIELFPNQQI
ncbi:hypothetical protein, partial [Microcoleus sp. BROC3]|uniref:hypothetical protein n=1 Tax=Microcoleus sp. BROC3 TaxID=3055323 RepID=UPI002FD464D8